MPDFTNLDPNLIASFWIYFVGSFIIGAVVGALACKLFFHRYKENLEQDKQRYLNRIKELEEKEKISDTRIEKLNEELTQLKVDVSQNALYWNGKKYDKQKAPGDKALFEFIKNHNENKK